MVLSLRHRRNSTLVKLVCETALGLHQDLSTRHDWPLKKAIVDLPIRMKGNLTRTSDNSLNPVGGQNKDIGAVSQTLLTEVKLHL